MFRTTHFVILFAVFLVAYAAPAAKESPAGEPAAVKALEPKKVEDKSDLATDASTHLAYSYRYAPSWHTFVPGFAGKILEHGFVKAEIPLLPYNVYYPPAARVLLVR